MTGIRRIEAYDATAAAALADVVAACVSGGDRPPLDEAALLHLQHRGLADAALWIAGDRAGFALVRHPDAGELDLAVVPADRRAGVGRALLGAALAAVEGQVTAWSHGDHPGAAALAARSGFRRTRELLVLTAERQALAAVLPGATPAAGSGASVSAPAIRAWRAGDHDELLRVNAAAFAHHPEQGAMDASALAERMAETWFDPAGLLVAESEGGLLGFHWTKVHGGGEGEIYVLGVDPAAQGTGLGRELALAGLRHLLGAGVRRVHLYVEADNASALRLYRGLGFVTDHAHVQYARP